MSESLATILTKTAATQPDHVAFKLDDLELTWNELRDKVHRIAGGLAKLGMKKGDTLAIMLNNRWEFIPCDLAAVTLGGVPFSIYQTSAPEQIEYLVSDAKNRIAIVEQAFLDRFHPSRVVPVGPFPSGTGDLERRLGVTVYEPVTYKDGLPVAVWQALFPRAERVVVCNVRGRSETTNKSDRIDADWLSEQLRLGALKSVYHGSPALGTLKELVRCYTNLVDDSTRVMSRVKAIYRAGPSAPPAKRCTAPRNEQLLDSPRTSNADLDCSAAETGIDR